MDEREKTRAWMMKLSAESQAALELLGTEHEGPAVRQFVETCLKPAFLHLAPDEPAYAAPDDYEARVSEAEEGCL